MAAAGKTVEVLCPTGRRQKVKVNPSMTVFQILQEVCKKQGYQDSEYDLKYQRKILNVTNIMRYLNLPNNAKLELVKCEKARVVSNVTVALQSEDGKRYQDDFNPDTMLLDILKKFISDIETIGSEKNQEPVCVYMRNEFRGISKLSKTSLKSIGASTGRIAIRLLYREAQAAEESISVDPTSGATKTTTTTPCELKESTSSTSSLEPNGKRIKLGEERFTASPPSQKAQNSVVSHTNGSSSSSSTDISSEGSAYTSLSILGAPPRQIFPDDVEMKKQDIMPDIPKNIVPKDNTPRNDFSNFKFPDAACTDPEHVAIDPHLIKKEVRLGMPCTRHAIIFRIEEAVSISSENQEPDDSFFQVTIDDLRKRMSALKSDRKGQQDDLLMTSAMRERKKIEKMANFEMIPVRLMLPGKLVLQGIFRPLETIGVIKDFVNEFVRPGFKKTELFVTPPRVVLKDKKQTLYDAKLFPAAVVHASFDNNTGDILKDEHLANISTSDEAEAIVDKVLKRKNIETSDYKPAKQSSDGQSLTSNQPSASSDIPSSSSSSSSKPANFSNNYNQKPKGAPKWFKTGR